MSDEDRRPVFCDTLETTKDILKREKIRTVSMVAQKQIVLDKIIRTNSFSTERQNITASPIIFQCLPSAISFRESVCFEHEEFLSVFFSIRVNLQENKNTTNKNNCVPRRKNALLIQIGVEIVWDSRSTKEWILGRVSGLPADFAGGDDIITNLAKER